LRQDFSLLRKKVSYRRKKFFPRRKKVSLLRKKVPYRRRKVPLLRKKFSLLRKKAPFIRYRSFARQSQCRMGLMPSHRPGAQLLCIRGAAHPLVQKDCPLLIGKKFFPKLGLKKRGEKRGKERGKLRGNLGKLISRDFPAFAGRVNRKAWQHKPPDWPRL
jgi:hypothetical protein